MKWRRKRVRNACNLTLGLKSTFLSVTCNACNDTQKHILLILSWKNRFRNSKLLLFMNYFGAIQSQMSLLALKQSLNDEIKMKFKNVYKCHKTTRPIIPLYCFESVNAFLLICIYPKLNQLIVKMTVTLNIFILNIIWFQ